ncbi:MAG: hypothetical protein WB791_06795, partial [Waddliaceae bacterium]
MNRLDKLCDLLSSFQEELQKTQSRLSGSEKEKEIAIAKCWVYCRPNMEALSLFVSSNSAEDAIILGQLAKIFFDRWQEELMEKNSHRAEYFCNSKEFPKNYLDEPKKGESLYRYLLRLVQIISTSSKLRALKEKCLR